MPETHDDAVRLLTRFEPVVRYTAGELFLPTAVDGFLHHAGLWRHVPGTAGGECLVPPGGLDPALLAERGERFAGDRLFLRFAQEPLGRAEYRRWRRERHASAFRPASRFAAVGLSARLVDAALRMSLLVRGKVPGGTRAAAHLRYTAHLRPEISPYYGRVFRDAGYLVLQYWYFYAMNDWRSTFGGVNDHEADWEHVTLFLTGPPDRPDPAWVLFSSHDKEGRDVRRRWDDPDLEHVGEHPVVYAGGGSHAGAYRRGDYVTKVSAPGLRRLRRYADGFGIPFLDYHRGDGPGIGPGEERRWTPVVVTDDTPWVRAYRGLWGLDTQDRFGGERAPAGPRYTRDGTVRPSWAYPVTWALLDAEPLGTAHEAELRERRLAAVESRLRDVRAGIEEDRDTSRQHLAAARATGRERPGADAGLGRSQAERVALEEERAALVRARTHPPAPAPAAGDPAHRPVPLEEQARRRRFRAAWAAASASVVLAGAALILVRPPAGVFWSGAGLAFVIVAVEAAAQSRLLRFLRATLVTVVALTAGWAVVMLVTRHWRVAVAAVLMAVAIGLWAGNLRAWLARR
ncbi:hypothetical protein [Dactylosporangium roseum]|uniref:hypothetical protein n=1 Tax=Dactylosporangium roseum TaxID=47989 RepID=UPI0031DC7F38